MNSHPTKEQVESAKAFVAGEATNEQWTLLVELHGTNDLLVVYSAAGNILAAALASAERDAERFRVLASHIKGPIRRDGLTFINWAVQVSDGTYGPKVFTLGELADVLAAQRKEGE